MRTTGRLFLAVAVAAFAGAAARGQEARETIDRAVRAVGGSSKLDKLKVMTYTARGTIASPAGDVAATREVMAQWPDLYRSTFGLILGDVKQQVTIALQGDRGWRAVGAQADDLGLEETQVVRIDVYVAWLTTLRPLTDGSATLAAIPGATVNGRATVGVKATNRGRPDVSLYFDKETGLLVKAAFSTREAGVQIQKESVFADHKDFGGVKLPTRQTDFQNGKKAAEWTVTGYQFPDKIDRAKFAKP